MILERVVHQFCGGGHMHFLQNARSIGADRSDTQVKSLGDLGNRLSGSDHAQDFELSGRERLV